MTDAVVSAAVQLTAGVAAQLKPPNPAMNLSAVVVQNLSGLNLIVTVAGSQHSLPSYMQDIYLTPSSLGAPVSVIGSNDDQVPAGVPAYVIANWYGPDAGGAAPDGSYPSSISPPAFALGLAIAEALLLQGIPSTLIEDVVIQTTLAGSGGQALAQVGQYASAVITLTGPGTNTNPVGFRQFDDLGNQLDGDTITLLPPTVTITQRFALVGTQLTLVNPGVNPVDVVVLASNRVQPSRTDSRNFTAGGDTWTLPGAAPLTNPQTLGGGTITKLQGAATMYAHMTNNFVGRIQLFSAAMTDTLFLFDSTELVVTSSSTKMLVRKMALPACDYLLQFAGAVFTPASASQVTFIPDML